MKITLIVPEFPCISETFILNQITGLVEAGHQVSIIALGRGSVSGKHHEDICRYGLIEQTRYLTPIPSGKISRGFSMLRTLASVAFISPRLAWRAFTYLLRNHADGCGNLRLLSLVLNRASQVCHFHFGDVGRLGVFLKKIGCPGKFITSFHGYDINMVPLQKGEQYYRELFETGDHFIANSRFTMQQMIRYGCPQEKIAVIPVGLHTGRYPYQEKTYPENGPVQLLTIGRLVEKKGYFYSINAVAALIRQGFNLHYTIAGDGVLRSELEKMVLTLGIGRHVTFTGEITQQEAVELYKAAHLFILASVTASNGDKEGQGLVLQEAQACGLPVISTLHNGIPDGVLDGQTGILVPEKDVQELVNAMSNLLQNGSSWRSMGEKGRKFVCENYEMKFIIGKLMALYEIA